MNGRDPFADLVLRPVSADDLEPLVATFHRLSPQSLYRRFFTLPGDPTSLVARHLALVDHRDHEAFVVLDGEQIVAVAQWDRSRAVAAEADVAIVVEDAWQRRGLGTALMGAVTGDAHRHGIKTITASVLTDNRAGVGLASRHRPTAVAFDGPETSVRFELAS